jgi:nicotinamide-nucleotide amidase
MVEIITIGDEILIGQIVDTNSAWMATELNNAGFQIVQITSVHDDAVHIKKALDEALGRAQVVLITGGLGPTKDDITKQTLCDYFNTRLVFDEKVLQNIRELYHTRQNVMNELTRWQAMVPENSVVIQNRAGSAPITWFEKEGKVVVSMPGVPHEMKKVMSDEIIPRLQKHFKTPVIIHKTVQVYGIPESQLALKLTDWESALPDFIKLAYLPNFGIVKLRLSGVSSDALKLEFALNQQIETLNHISVSYTHLTLPTN